MNKRPSDTGMMKIRCRHLFLALLMLTGVSTYAADDAEHPGHEEHKGHAHEEHKGHMHEDQGEHEHKDRADDEHKEHAEDDKDHKETATEKGHAAQGAARSHQEPEDKADADHKEHKKNKDHSDHGSHGGHHDDHSEEPEKGPHNGRLLKDGNFTVELAIFEKGVPPEYRAWASDDGKAIAPKDWQLRVELTRLGGKVDKFTFAAQEGFLRSQSEVEEPHSFDVSVTATYQNKSHHWAFPSYEGRIQLTAALAKQAGVTTAVARAGKLQQNLKLYGQVQPDPDHIRQLRARFPGVIRSVNARIGTQVNAGDVLATIEANESLRTYNITAPIAGTVTERHANEGELAGEQALFTIANTRQLNVSLPVFAQDATRVRIGQKVHITSEQQVSDSQVLALTPAADSPTLTARAALDNSSGEWTPGAWVNAAITLAEIPVALMVDNQALQAFRDWQVVFIQVGDTYEIRPLELGRSDGHFTEVLGGLNVGDQYVVGNSFLLKSDLEKSGASHDH